MGNIVRVIVCLVLVTLSVKPSLALAAGYASVSGGVSISSSPVILGKNFSTNFTLKEIRGQSITYENIAVAILDPNNNFVFDFAMYSNVYIGAYGTWNRSPTNYIYTSKAPGTYKAVVRGKYQGQWFNFGTTGSGVNPKSFSVIRDTTKPVFNSFAVSPSTITIGGSPSINYTVSDSGGSGLKQVELWRANDSGGAPGTWTRLQTRTVSGNGPVSGSFSNTPSAVGAYWYGLHVVDNVGNWNPEPSPRKVTVTAATPVPTDDHGNSCSAATTLSVNSSRVGAINSSGDIDYFRIQVPSSGTLTVRTTGATDTYGFLKNSSCTNIISNDDTSTSDQNFRISRSLTAGTYYVAVRHYSSSGTGSYTLSANFVASAPVLTDDHGNNCSGATTMAVNSSKTGVIGTAGDWDYFKVTVPSAGTLTAYSTGTTDTYGYLKNSSCTNVKGDDDTGEGNNFSFSSTVATGTYYIAVRHYSSTSVGAYGLRVNFTTTNSSSFIKYPLSANLSIPVSSVTLVNPLGAQAFGGTHTGVDIMKSSGSIVYSIDNGIVKINNTNRNYGNAYSNYWNSFLVIQYPSSGLYVYYGHLSSSLAIGAQVSKFQQIGTLRRSYNLSNIATPSNDHLHLGVKTNLISSGWGYTVANTSLTSLLTQGWRDPVAFMRGQ